MADVNDKFVYLNTVCLTLFGLASIILILIVTWGTDKSLSATEYVLYKKALYNLMPPKYGTHKELEINSTT